MEAADRPNAQSLELLGKLIRWAEEIGIYLDITGLACYRTADVPKWYDSLSQRDRWQVQGRFLVGDRRSGPPVRPSSATTFMNEPIVPGEKRPPGAWYSGKLFGGYEFVQFISLDATVRPLRRRTRCRSNHSRKQFAQRQTAPEYSRPAPFHEAMGPSFGLRAGASSPILITVHVYTESGKLDEARTVLKQFAVGKPLVIEETFNLTCSPPELRQFLLDSRGQACGWNGALRRPNDCRFRRPRTIGPAHDRPGHRAEWLALFKSLRPEMMGEGDPPEK